VVPILSPPYFAVCISRWPQARAIQQDIKAIKTATKWVHIKHNNEAYLVSSNGYPFPNTTRAQNTIHQWFHAISRLT